MKNIYRPNNNKRTEISSSAKIYPANYLISTIV